MSDTLEIFGRTFPAAEGIKAYDSNGNLLTFTRNTIDVPIFTIVWSADYQSVVSATCNKTFDEIGDYECAISRESTTEQPDPTDYSAYFYSVSEAEGDEFYHFIIGGSEFADADIFYYKDSRGIQVSHPSSHNLTLNATSNGTYYPDDGFYSEVTVNVPRNLFLETKTVNPTESSQTVTADTGYDGLESVTVNAIDSTYVGSGIVRRSASDLYGEYSQAASTYYMNAPAGYYENLGGKAVPNGSVSVPSSISGNNANVNAGTIGKLTLTETISIKPTLTAGYIPATMAAQNSTVSLTASVKTQAAKTVTPTESVQIAVAAKSYTTGDVKVDAISPTYVGSGITRQTFTEEDALDGLNGEGGYIFVNSGYYADDAVINVGTSDPHTPSISVNSSTGLITSSVNFDTGWIPDYNAGTQSGTLQLTTQAAKTITPTESEQTAVASGVYTTGVVKVGAISSTYVGSGISRKSAADITEEVIVSENGGLNLTIPTGYYSSDSTKLIPIASFPKINSAEYVYESEGAGAIINMSIDIESAGYFPEGQFPLDYLPLSNISGITIMSSTHIEPKEYRQTIHGGTFITGSSEVGTVIIDAIPSGYVGSMIDRNDSTSLTVSGATVTAPAGYYAESVSKSVASGSTGTPSATKGTVSNHSISVTPSVTNTTGYITGGTKTGTAVTVTASELASGNKEITSNGTDIDVIGYSTVSVAVPGASLQAKTGINPTTSSQTITADSGYDGLSSVQINAMPTMTLPTSASSSSSGTSKATIGRSTSAQYINIPTGYNGTASYYTISATPNGSATTPATTITANPTISVSSSGLITATASASQNITPTVSAGYVSSGTAGTITVSGSKTQQLTTKGATTYNTSTTDQTIASGTYLTGTQTIKAVTVSGLDASKILSGTTIMIGDANDADRIASVTGTVTFSTIYSGSSAPSSSTGVNGDIYIQS